MNLYTKTYILWWENLAQAQRHLSLSPKPNIMDLSITPQYTDLYAGGPWGQRRGEQMSHLAEMRRALVSEPRVRSASKTTRRKQSLQVQRTYMWYLQVEGFLN